MGRGYGGGGERESIFLSLHCHRQNDSCIKVGSDESHFNVPLIVMDSHKTVSTKHNRFEEKGQPKQNRTEIFLYTSLASALPLGQTGLLFEDVHTSVNYCNKISTGGRLIYCMVYLHSTCNQFYKYSTSR